MALSPFNHTPDEYASIGSGQREPRCLKQSEILRGVLEGALKQGRLGVVFPAAEQKTYAEKEFGRPGVEVYADHVSPYEPDDVEGLLKRLGERDLDLIFLNCFGFPRQLKEKVVEATGKPVIQSNALIARVLKELVAG